MIREVDAWLAKHLASAAQSVLTNELGATPDSSSKLSDDDFLTICRQILVTMVELIAQDRGVELSPEYVAEKAESFNVVLYSSFFRNLPQENATANDWLKYFNTLRWIFRKAIFTRGFQRTLVDNNDPDSFTLLVAIHDLEILLSWRGLRAKALEHVLSHEIWHAAEKVVNVSRSKPEYYARKIITRSTEITVYYLLLRMFSQKIELNDLVNQSADWFAIYANTLLYFLYKTIPSERRANLRTKSLTPKSKNS